MQPIAPFRLEAEYHERVWGGNRLRPRTGSNPIGEAWIVYEKNKVADGPDAGQTLGELAVRYGADLLGSHAGRKAGRHFPLLIKLLDTADWLSIQVHPDNHQAARLEGPSHAGKTEAWHIIEAEQGARLISGLRPGTTQEQFARAVHEGRVLDYVQYLDVRAGDSVFTPAGTVHALGPGLLLYEVQQTSDLTYRLFDWNRPQAAGRSLHLDKSLAVTDTDFASKAIPEPATAGGTPATLLTCQYFTLQLLKDGGSEAPLDTERKSFHAVTAIEGEMTLQGDGWKERLRRFETAIVPAVVGKYAAVAESDARALIASV
jgi:mannose-6-phosphate isomerase